MTAPSGLRLVLWRHGRTAWNEQRRFQGHTDVPLDATGRAQAARAARLLAGLPPTSVISSDLSRALETAQALAERTGQPVTVDPRLRETFGGSWEGRLDTEIAASDGAAFAAWRSGGLRAAGGHGETRVEVAHRAAAAVTDALTGRPDDAVMVVVTHGGTVRSLLGLLLGLPQDRWSVLGGLANCSWSVLERFAGDGPTGWRLTEHNAGSLPTPVLGDDE